MSPRLLEQLNSLPEYLGSHLILTLSALFIGLLVSLPAAILATRFRRIEWPLLSFASVMQTIPALALLALMVPLLGRIGFLPALIGLVLYSMLPILRNTVTGIQDIDPDLIEAARALGMNPRQMLFKVQLPLAAPVIVAGIRIATVWVVGIATLSTPVGAPSLGNYIFSGLQTQNYHAVMVGVVAAAALALILDGLIRLFELSITRRSRFLLILALFGLVLIFFTAFFPGILGFDEARSEEPAIVIGTKSFTEQYILANLIEDLLEREELRAETVESLGSTVVFDALAGGEIDCYVDYSGTIWANHMQRDDQPGREEVLEKLEKWLREEYGIVSLGALGFENAYALAVREKMARVRELETIDDLVPSAPTLTIGGDYEFFSRPEWRSLKRAYRLDFAATRSFDASLMYSAVREGQVDVVAAFSTDGRIIAFDLEILEDNRNALPPYDAVLLLSPSASKNSKLRRALEPIIGAITNEEMRQANKMVDLEKKTIEEAAQYLLEPLLSSKIDQHRNRNQEH